MLSLTKMKKTYWMSGEDVARYNKSPLSFLSYISGYVNFFILIKDALCSRGFESQILF